ncbi:MAG: hypothetical protein P9L92_10775 [Candidatus Electryonea clarkiae]|nr:hypothetical protein [Candidatus Electryonea clarkiae]MDP8287118.1 hypothetical protein [Candidatus Electryonea clarkiae]
MDEKRQLLQHFLAALAYRTQKSLRDAPDSYAAFRVIPGVRTPHEILFHMTGVLGLARTFFTGESEYRPDRLPEFQQEIKRFHDILENLSSHLIIRTPLQGTTPEKLLQGPFADAMTHAGQLALLRRLHGNPIEPENFHEADIDPSNLGPDQPDPISPDEKCEEPED